MQRAVRHQLFVLQCEVRHRRRAVVPQPVLYRRPLVAVPIRCDHLQLMGERSCERRSAGPGVSRRAPTRGTGKTRCRTGSCIVAHVIGHTSKSLGTLRKSAKKNDTPSASVCLGHMHAGGCEIMMTRASPDCFPLRARGCTSASATLQNQPNAEGWP